MNFRLSLAGRGVNTIRLFVMVCFIFGIISLINTCTTTQQPRSAKSFTTEHRALLLFAQLGRRVLKPDINRRAPLPAEGCQ
jgi:hypothetical protein